MRLLCRAIVSLSEALYLVVKRTNSPRTVEAFFVSQPSSLDSFFLGWGEWKLPYSDNLHLSFVFFPPI